MITVPKSFKFGVEISFSKILLITQDDDMNTLHQKQKHIR